MNGNKLYLRQEMKRTYLIQRLCKPTHSINPFSFGGGLRNGGLSKEAMTHLMGIFSFDYMGASEFEWGAVPAALQFIAEEASKKNVTFGECQGVHYICPKPYEAGVKAVITTLLEDESSLRLKEHCGLSKRIKNPQDGYSKDNVGWLELNNGFFFFTDVEMFENTKRLLGVK